jgi:hypothetical protein
MLLLARRLAQLCIDSLDREFYCQPLHPFLEFSVGWHGQDYEPDELGDGGDVQRGSELTVAIRMGYMNNESSDQ